MRRFIALFAVLALVLGVFGGCGDKKTNSSDNANNNSGVSDSIFSVENVAYLDSDGEAVYRIVRPDGDTEATTIAAYVFKQMKGALGVNMKNVLDSEDGTDKYEILIGNTNRPESSQALQYLYDNNYGRYNDYIICTIGKKIVINGITNEAVTTAAEYFIANFVKAEGVQGGVKYIKATDGEFKDVTVNGTNIGKYSFVRDNTWCSWLVQEEVRKIQEDVRQKTGFLVELVEDDEVAEGEYEINIGYTNRAGVADMASGNYEEYEIKISGKKVYILGGSTRAVQVAVTEFAKLLQKGTVTDADSKVGTYSQTIETYDSASYYRLKWGDDFDGDALDETKWTIKDFVDKGVDGKPSVAIKNDYTFAMSGGNLIFRAIKNEDGSYMICDAIKSKESMYYNRGYIEMRAKVPDGKGVYSSFWGSSPSGGDRLEIDIFESLGNAHLIRANVHKWMADKTHTSLDKDKTISRDYTLKEGNYSDQYHIYSLLWDDTQITCMFDGMVYYTQPMDEYCIDKYISVIAGFNVGWADRKTPDSSIEWPLEYHIDYIHLYQIDGQNIMYK